MDPLKLDLCTCDVGAEADTPEEYAQILGRRVLQSWGDGADVVLLPEYAWMGLERFVTGHNKVRGVAELFWNEQWPFLRTLLSRPGKTAVLGTAPFVTPDGSLRNRAPILCEGRELHQDKMRLTPWEMVFQGGEAQHLWRFKGATFAVLVCLDIEVPETAVALRGRGVDCILVPSATESILGVERINRCASARAVELGCYVGVAHLTGTAKSELVDVNMGGLGWYAPSQGAFMEKKRERCSDVFLQGFEVLSITMEQDLLHQTRANTTETNPANVTPSPLILRELQ
jgi:predicted amidohydrolase